MSTMPQTQRQTFGLKGEISLHWIFYFPPITITIYLAGIWFLCLAVDKVTLGVPQQDDFGAFTKALKGHFHQVHQRQ